MKAQLFDNKENQILKRYDYEIKDLEKITRTMWDKLMKIYPSAPNLTLDDLKDLNIVRLTFIKDSSCEIQSIGGTTSRLLVLPLLPEINNLFKDIISKVVVH